MSDTFREMKEALRDEMKTESMREDRTAAIRARESLAGLYANEPIIDALKCINVEAEMKAYDEAMSNADSSNNNGGKTDYYQIPSWIKDFDDFAEWRGLNGFQFNMGKVFWTFNTGRHSGTDYERDLNKIIYYANREKKRIKRNANQ